MLIHDKTYSHNSVLGDYVRSHYLVLEPDEFPIDVADFDSGLYGVYRVGIAPSLRYSGAYTVVINRPLDVPSAYLTTDTLLSEVGTWLVVPYLMPMPYSFGVILGPELPLTERVAIYPERVVVNFPRVLNESVYRPPSTYRQDVSLM